MVGSVVIVVFGSALVAVGIFGEIEFFGFLDECIETAVCAKFAVSKGSQGENCKNKCDCAENQIVDFERSDERSRHEHDSRKEITFRIRARENGICDRFQRKIFLFLFKCG